MFALYERQLIPGAGCSWDTFVTPVLKSSVGVHKNWSKARRVSVSRKMCGIFLGKAFLVLNDFKGEFRRWVWTSMFIRCFCVPFPF